MAATAPARVIAVVPLFRPTEAQLQALTTLESQVDAVVAVDDGSDDIDLLHGPPSSIIFLRMASNVGIARCLNVGVGEARRLGATHVLTVDQDSRVPDGYVESALETLQALDDAGTGCGGIGAGRIGPHRVGGSEIAPDVRDGLNGIQSGWLLPVRHLDLVGSFDEDLFIDCVDVDYLLRSSIAGLPIGVTDRCVLDHALGSDERTIRVGGRSLVFSYHPPFRRYYITRNRLTMLRRYLLKRPVAVLGQTTASLRIGALCLLLGRNRRAQLVALWIGLVHGIAGRGGRVPSRIERRLVGTA